MSASSRRPSATRPGEGSPRAASKKRGRLSSPPFSRSWAHTHAMTSGLLTTPVSGALRGTLLDILISPAAGAAIERRPCAHAVPGCGIANDRYARNEGTWSSRPSWRSEVTLVAEEQLVRAGLSPEHARRNLLTRGLQLEALVGWRLHVGEVVLVAQRVCSPCRLLQRRSGLPVGDLLKDGGGLRARIVTGGVLRRGDEICALAPNGE